MNFSLWVWLILQVILNTKRLFQWSTLRLDEIVFLKGPDESPAGYLLATRATYEKVVSPSNLRIYRARYFREKGPNLEQISIEKAVLSRL